jgi:hypothetical protein
MSESEIEITIFQVSKLAPAPSTTMMAHPDFLQLLVFGILIPNIHSAKLIFYSSSVDETMQSAVYLAENLLDPKTATSQDPLDCPFSREFGSESRSEFLKKSMNESRLRQFGAAMHGMQILTCSGTLLTGNFISFLATWISGANKL